MPPIHHPARATTLAATLAACLSPGLAAGKTLTVIYQNPPSNSFSTDLQAVLPVAYGGLMVTSYQGGANGAGEVFLLTPGKPGQPWTQTDLHDFTGSSATPADGSNPSTLVLDASGNVWGLTNYNGANNGGTLYELIKPASKTGSWTYRLVGAMPANFLVGTQNNGKSGWTGALFDPAGNLDILAATNNLFCANVCGVLLRIPAANLAAGSTAFTTLYDFASGPTGNGQGIQPQGLARSPAGDFFGFYYGGGSTGYGFVWQLTPGRNGVYTEHVLYNFCQQSQCPDGANPSGVVIKNNTTLYGVYRNWGTLPAGAAATAGGSFKLVKSGKSWAYTNLYTLYDSNPGGSDTIDYDVQNPTSVILSKTGALVATLISGGTTIHGNGVICERNGGVTAFSLGTSPDSNLSNGFESEGGACPNDLATSGPKNELTPVAEAAPGVFYGAAEYYHNGGLGTDTHQNLIYQIK